MSQTFEPQILDHPLIQHKISLMRKKETGSKDFRELASEVATLMCYEATRDLPLKEVTVETPICRCKTKMIAGRKLAIVSILRAGLGMVDGMLTLIPAAKWATSACTGMRRPPSPSSISASCPVISASGRSLWWTPCWPPVAAPSMPFP